MSRVMELLKKVPPFVWIIVASVSIAETFIWVGMLQIDPLYWNCYWTSDKIDVMWIPSLGLTYYDSFILFFNIVVIGAHIPIAVIIWLTGEHLGLSKKATGSGVCLLFFGVGFGIALHDFCHALWQVGRYKEIISPQGGYFGFLIMLVTFLLLLSKNWPSLSRRFKAET